MQIGDSFGEALALHDDTLVLTSLRGDSATQQNTGTAYIFNRDGSNWQESVILAASDGSRNHLFGGAIAVDANTVVVGTNTDDEAAENAGALYVCTISSS